MYFNPPSSETVRFCPFSCSAWASFLLHGFWLYWPSTLGGLSILTVLTLPGNHLVLSLSPKSISFFGRREKQIGSKLILCVTAPVCWAAVGLIDTGAAKICSHPKWQLQKCSGDLIPNLKIFWREDTFLMSKSRKTLVNEGSHGLISWCFPLYFHHIAEKHIDVELVKSHRANPTYGP